MDGRRFDALTAAWSATSLPRRRSLRVLAATAVAAWVGQPGVTEAKKKNKKKNKKAECPKGKYKCGESCIDTYWCCEDGAAKAPDCGETCCGPGEECCGGQCSNPLLAPLCSGACETSQCVPALGALRCVYTPNCQTPFGGECCVSPESCCPLTDGTTACLKPHHACGACMYRCPETGTLCCSTANSCGNVNNEAKCL